MATKGKRTKARKAGGTRTAARRARKPARPRAATPRVAPAADDQAPRDEVREIFRSYDYDGSGSIDAGELARLLEALGMAPSEEDLAVALDVVDANHSGKVSWSEFSAWWRAQATVR